MFFYLKNTSFFLLKNTSCKRIQYFYKKTRTRLTRMNKQCCTRYSFLFSTQTYMHFVQTDASIFLIQTYTFVIDSIANTCLFILVDGLKYISFLNILKMYTFFI